MLAHNPLRLHTHSRGAPKALAAPCRRAVSRASTVLIRAQRTAEEYAVALRSSLDENDWTKTFELMTELTVLKVDVPLAAQEVAVVSYARGGQWQRAEALYKLLQGRGHVAAGATTQELVSALAAAGKGGEAAALLAAAAVQAGADVGALAPAHCVVARALAREGRLSEAYAMLNRMMREDMRIDPGTFSSVAASCMDHGDTALAEEVLEMRDYL